MLDGVEIRGPLTGRAGEVLTDEALAFVAALQREFRGRRAELLARRAANEIAGGAGAWDDEVAADVLDAYAVEARSVLLTLILMRPDREVVFDRRAPRRFRERATALLGAHPADSTRSGAGGDSGAVTSGRRAGTGAAGTRPEGSAAAPPETRLEEPFPPHGDAASTSEDRSGEGPSPGHATETPIRVLYWHEVQPLLGDVVAIRDVKKLPFRAPPGPAGLMLFLPVALLLAGAAALFMFRTQVHRLRALENLAVRVTEGDLEARVEDSHGDELGRLGQRLNRMTESLAAARQSERESDRQRRQLLADISHELATPLTSIRGYAETLLTLEVDAEERTTYTRHIQREAERLDVLTRDLFELARFEAGAVPLIRVNLDWAELCRHTVDRFRPRFEAAGLYLAWKEPAGPMRVSADGHRMEQVIENLLSNALRYVPAGGRVEVWLTATPSWRVLAVEDDGPGIPAQDLPHVFDRFYRADPARALPGSGLGLAIVREIVERHGGNVRAVNLEPHGAGFFVELPAATARG